MADARFVARAWIALLVANATYWPTVAPIVRAQLERWRRHAEAIGNPTLRSIALDRLAENGELAQAAATLAIRAPLAHRRQAVEAMVALQVMYDYLDTLTESPAADPLLNGRALHSALTDAFSVELPANPDYYRHCPSADDAGYLRALVTAIRDALALLPAADTVRESALRSAAQCTEAQTRAHAAASLGPEQARRWAQAEAATLRLDWRAFLAGAASSVLALHAHIAGAADPSTTAEQAAQIDSAYRSIAALPTMLNSLVDHAEDARTGRLPFGYIRYYEDIHHFGDELLGAARNALALARNLPDAPFHVTIIVGIVAFHTSQRGARGAVAQPIVVRLHRELWPLILPTLALMRTWRLARGLRRR
ncbi:MAG: DUF2600 family protein [Solirubrobacteraceae bacterium]